MLAIVFVEAFEQLQDTTYNNEDIPSHIHETLWIPIQENMGANTTRLITDLELPNEDAKVHERMYALIIDEQAAFQFKPIQQACVSGGEIMHNIIGMHEAFHHAQHKQQLLMFLLLDCTKGFNYASHERMLRVWERAALPSTLLFSIKFFLST